MRVGAFLRFVGYCRVRLSIGDCERFMNVCMRYGFIYYCLELDAEHGAMRAILPIYSYRRVFTACRSRGIGIALVSRHGALPTVFAHRAHTLGVLIGTVLAVLIFILSGSVIWRVDVSGNAEMSSDEVLELLEECGLSVGSRKASLDTDIIEQAAAIRNERIAWISVNISGTVARVQIREAARGGDIMRPANLVARYDGEIVSLTVYSGFVSVGEGDLVRAGQLLVSGIYGGDGTPLRYTRASGSVIARVSRDFKIEIPLLRSVKLPTGERIEQKTLNFFGKSIKLFLNYGNLPPSCDIMNYEYALDPFSLGALPISINTRVYLPYVLTEVELGEEEAEAQAYALLRERLDTELAGAQILSMTVDGSISGGTYILSCRTVALCDIARVLEFDVADGKY